MKNGFLLLLIAVLFNCLTASAQSWLWGRQGTPGLKNFIMTGNVATNRTGNVYRIGSFGSIITFGALTATNYYGSGETFLVKYDQNGNVLWLRPSIIPEPPVEGPDPAYAMGYSVASDDSDNAYITGSYTNSAIMTGSHANPAIIFDHDTLFSPANTSLLSPFLVKYDPNGNVVWAKSGGNIYGIGLSVARDKFDHEYVTGITMPANPNILGAYSSHVFLTKYDRNGNIVWTVKPDSLSTTTPDTNVEVGNSVTTDISGNVYISGQFQDSLIFGNYKLYSANIGVFIAKFDSNGNILWAQQSTNNLASIPLFQRFSNPGELGLPFEVTGGYAVATDGSGAAYLTGPFTISQTFGSHNFTVNSNTMNSFFLLKYNPNGTIAWGEEAAPLDDSSSWGSCSICTDDSNHIYITGGEYYVRLSNTGPPYYAPTNTGPPYYAQKDAFAFGNDTLTCDTSINNAEGRAFLLKLDSSGTIICGSILPGGSYFDQEEPNEPTELSVFVTSDSTGKFVYIGGPFYYSLIFGNDTLINNSGGSDAAYGEPYTGRWQGCECNLVISGTPLQTICSGYTAILTASGATSYTWSPAATLSSSIGDSVVADPVVTTTYTVIGTNLVGCEAIVTDTIYVLEGVNIPIITQDGNVLITSSTNDNQWFRNDSILAGETGRTDTATISGWYKVEAINPSNGCNTVSDSIYVKASGIVQLSINGDQLSVYPNPTTGEIVITISSSAEDIKDWNMQIDDVLGQTVYIRPSLSYSNDIDLSELPGGVYFITVINKRGRTVVPVTKQ